MGIKAKIAVAATSIMLAVTPAMAQNNPAPGGSGATGTFGGMAIGSYVMIGGVLFVVTAAGLVLYDGDGSSTPMPPASTTGTGS